MHNDWGVHLGLYICGTQRTNKDTKIHNYTLEYLLTLQVFQKVCRQSLSLLIKHAYIDNTDWVGGLFAEVQSRGRRLPRLGLCKQAPEMDTACEDFLARLYCI